jgi:hypothetical protein
LSATGGDAGIDQRSPSPSTVAETAAFSAPWPLCTAAQANPAILWPPDHKLIPVSIVGVTDSNNDAIAINVSAVKQDEPTNGLGDGDAPVDAVITGGKLLLRAERSG